MTTTAVIETGRRRRVLHEKLRELRGGSIVYEDLRIEHMADPLDQVRSSADREVAVQRLDQQARLIHDIQSALDKIRDGNYGPCERCDEIIPAKRLNAIPWARRCVPCQAHAEAAECDGKPVFDHAA